MGGAAPACSRSSAERFPVRRLHRPPAAEAELTLKRFAARPGLRPADRHGRRGEPQARSRRTAAHRRGQSRTQGLLHRRHRGRCALRARRQGAVHRHRRARPIRATSTWSSSFRRKARTPSSTTSTIWRRSSPHENRHASSATPKRPRSRGTLKIEGRGRYDISTGIRFFDHMLELFTKHGGFDLKLKADGDLDVDQHHTVEDVGIVLGPVVRQGAGRSQRHQSRRLLRPAHGRDAGRGRASISAAAPRWSTRIWSRCAWWATCRPNWSRISSAAS